MGAFFYGMVYCKYSRESSNLVLTPILAEILHGILEIIFILSWAVFCYQIFIYAKADREIGANLDYYKTGVYYDDYFTDHELTQVLLTKIEGCDVHLYNYVLDHYANTLSDKTRNVECSKHITKATCPDPRYKISSENRIVNYNKEMCFWDINIGGCANFQYLIATTDLAATLLNSRLLFSMILVLVIYLSILMFYLIFITANVYLYMKYREEMVKYNYQLYEIMKRDKARLDAFNIVRESMYNRDVTNLILEFIGDDLDFWDSSQEPSALLMKMITSKECILKEDHCYPDYKFFSNVGISTVQNYSCSSALLF